MIIYIRKILIPLLTSICLVRIMRALVIRRIVQELESGIYSATAVSNTLCVPTIEDGIKHWYECLLCNKGCLKSNTNTITVLTLLHDLQQDYQLSCAILSLQTHKMRFRHPSSPHSQRIYTTLTISPCHKRAKAHVSTIQQFYDSFSGI